LISFDAASVAAFGLDSAKFAVLFFDKTRKIIGVKITRTDKEEGSLPMSRRRRSVSLKSPQFFHQYGLTVEESQRFEVSRDPDDGMLLISVRDVQRRRGRRPKKV
jgi:predicted nucleic acid-binding protein